MPILWTLTNIALAECAPIEIPLEEATTLGVRNPPAGIAITGVEGSTVIRARSEECGIRVSRDGHQLFLSGRAKVGRIDLEVPASLAVISVYRHRGPVHVSDVSGRVAVVSGEGPIEVRRVGDLRVGEVVGDVLAEDVAGNLLVDHLTGEATWDRVAGAVSVDDSRGRSASLLAQ